QRRAPGQRRAQGHAGQVDLSPSQTQSAPILLDRGAFIAGLSKRSVPNNHLFGEYRLPLQPLPGQQLLSALFGWPNDDG
ncbi:MAG: hypothetical protein KDC10_13075, partial [Calditrichaeota bacterium]|nr:hypothetical protein [Calditrichota bacterium]